MSKLFSQLKSYWKACVLGPLLKLAEAGLELMIPMIVAAVIDRGVGGGDRGYILHMSLLLVGLGVLGLCCSVTAQYLSARAAVGAVTMLRHELYAHIQRFPYATLDQIGIPTLIARMSSDMDQVQTGVNLTLRLLLRSPFVVFGAMIMAFTIDTRAALWFVGAIPVLAAAVFGVMLLTMPRYKRVQERLDRVLSTTRENLNGVRVLRAFCREAEECKIFAVQNRALTEAQQRVGRLSGLMLPVTYVIVDLAVIGLIYTGAIRVQAGILTQGAVVALYNYMSQILVELIKLADLIINISRALASAKRIQAVLDISDAELAQPGLPGGDTGVRVEFEQAALRYANSPGEALSGLTLRALPGQVIGVIGGTGSGKSTLVNLIPRFYEATRGRVLVNGVDVRAWEPEALRRRIGVVPQKAMLFQGTIRENLCWGCADATEQGLLEAVKAAQAEEILAAKGGLDGEIEQFGRNLSGGQRQRLTIARALVRKPEILILDDSGSALDFATDAALRRAIRALPYQPTVFLIAQRTNAVRHADQIVVLDEGRVVGLGTHKTLLESCTVYREIHVSQFRKEAVQ